MTVLKTVVLPLNYFPMFALNSIRIAIFDKIFFIIKIRVENIKKIFIISKTRRVFIIK